MHDDLHDISQKDSQYTVSVNAVEGSPAQSWQKQAILGFALSNTIAIVAVRAGSLTWSGALGAVATGTLTTARGGYARAALLVGFFAGSTLISRLPGNSATSVCEIAQKGSQRDIWQVLANGGVSTTLACISGSRAGLLPYVGSLSAVTGDTWATEIGSRSTSVPRHILSLKPVMQGTSGGVTFVGSAASLLGGTFIGALAASTHNVKVNPYVRRRELVLAGAISGAIGSLTDSFLGATLQERRWCNQCQILTERRIHRCGAATEVIGGIPGITNDGVNLLCALTGATAGFLLHRWFQG